MISLARGAAVAAAVAVAVFVEPCRRGAGGELKSALKSGGIRGAATTASRIASRREAAGILTVVDSAATVVGARLASLLAGAARITLVVSCRFVATGATKSVRGLVLLFLCSLALAAGFLDLISLAFGSWLEVSKVGTGNDLDGAA